ncbi:hypothetical protein E1B28_005304 [Marasmius oreades]|uniref:Uncharacterized protein n=1 Tax=Marasmius oreades TaxID=181124 RepID=A0A9P7V0G6_9AGAR|nr:uncharacterized protein E1B28_005304 [Marasmius oreades]KAG7097996.1 hypothetical protein E1B28_005304 [Marasmius oreades]
MSSTIRHSVEGTRSPEVKSTQVLPIHEKFLRSDYVPTGDEIQLQSQALEDDYAKFDQIPQILEGSGRMERECAERIRLREAVLSPIRRVPVELWREIFSLFCFSGDYPILLYSSERDIPGTDPEPDNSKGHYNYKKENYIGVKARPYLLSVCAHWHFYRHWNPETLVLNADSWKIHPRPFPRTRLSSVKVWQLPFEYLHIVGIPQISQYTPQQQR